MARVEGEPMDGQANLELAPYLARVGQPLLVPPRPGELDAHDVCHRVLDMKRPWALHDGHARSSRHAEISLGRFRSVSEIQKPGLNQPLNDRKNHRRRDTEHEHSVCCF
jgi:hypothetical protein